MPPFTQPHHAPVCNALRVGVAILIAIACGISTHAASTSAEQAPPAATSGSKLSSGPKPTTTNSEMPPQAAEPLTSKRPPAASAPEEPPLPKEGTEKADCTTEQCHPGVLAKAPPLPKGHEDCGHCHLSSGNGKTHPQEGSAPLHLATDMCLDCHPKIVDFDYLHPPVAAGDCSACHTFHGSPPSLLAENSGRLLCYNCHQPVTHEGDTYLHGDVAQQKCSSCHTVHGSFFNHLLGGPYSTDFFNDYDEKKYALCFQCHKIDLLLHPYTSYNTNFRDGKKNLHYVHVNRPTRGRSCKLCHEIHSSRLPKLMADKVSFGDWEMPVNFIITDQGGQCTPGCHAKATYNRNKLSSPGLREYE